MVEGAESAGGHAKFHVGVVPGASGVGEVDFEAGAQDAFADKGDGAVEAGGGVEGGACHGGHVDAGGAVADGGGREGACRGFDFEAEGVWIGVADYEGGVGFCQVGCEEGRKGEGKECELHFCWFGLMSSSDW